MVAVCSPDLDLFCPDGRLRGAPLISAAEAVEFVPWLKASLPVKAVLNLESKVEGLTGVDALVGGAAEKVQASILNAFVDQVLATRLPVTGNLPFDRMGGAFERVHVGLMDVCRLRAAMRAVLSGMVVSCECPAYPTRWKQRLRRGGEKARSPSLFDFEEEPCAGAGSIKVNALDRGAPLSVLASAGADQSLGPISASRSERGGWGLFNGPACVWVWPPIDPLTLDAEEAGISGRRKAGDRHRAGSYTQGLGNDYSLIVGGVGSREPTPSEAELAASVGKDLMGAGLWTETGPRMETGPWIETGGGLDAFEPAIGLEDTGSNKGDASAGVGLVSGGAKGIDTAYLGASARPTVLSTSFSRPTCDQTIRRWVVLPEGLGSIGLRTIGAGTARDGHEGSRRGDVQWAYGGPGSTDRTGTDGLGGAESCSPALGLGARSSKDVLSNVSSNGVRWVSAFGFRAGFTGTAAMLRNRLIYAFADETIVFSCRLGVGGTWGGAVSALREGRRVRVAIIADSSGNPDRESDVFRALVRRGAIPLCIPVQEDAVQCEAEPTGPRGKRPKRRSETPDEASESKPCLAPVRSEAWKLGERIFPYEPPDSTTGWGNARPAVS